MLVTRLVEYWGRQEATPKMYKKSYAKWIVRLKADGTFLGVDKLTSTGKANDPGKQFLLPTAGNRGSKIAAYPFADNASYVFGLVAPGKDPSVSEKRHQAFLNTIEDCIKKTGHPLMPAVEKFLALGDRYDLNPDLTADDTVVFEVAGVVLAETPEVQAYWAGTFVQNAASDDVCLACNQEKSLARTHNLRISGRLAPPGPTGSVLVTYDKTSFQSYGLKTAPYCDDCAEAYVKAINHLQSQPDKSLTLGGVTYLFWCKSTVQVDLSELLTKPTEQNLKSVLDILNNPTDSGVDENDFYLLAARRNSSRVSILRWQETGLNQVLGRMRDFYQNQGFPQPFGIYKLLSTLLEPDEKSFLGKDVLALVNHVLLGEPVPLSILTRSVQRGFRERSISDARAALLRLGLKMKAGDEMETDNVGYLCGKLFSVLESLQWRAHQGRLNRSLADQYFSAAGKTPLQVFPGLVNLANQAHLGMLRREGDRGWAAQSAISRRIEELVIQLQGYPSTLTPHEQALFQLGYYDQKAEDRQRIQEAQEKKEAVAV